MKGNKPEPVQPSRAELVADKLKLQKRLDKLEPKMAELESKAKTPSELADQVRVHVLKRARSKRKMPYTVTELANVCDRSPSAIGDAIDELKQRGYLVGLRHDYVDVGSVEPAGKAIPLEHFTDGKWFRLGIVSDNHSCNKYERSDVLEAAYDWFAKEGIRSVYHAGNWIDGEFYFNKHELVVPPGFEVQVNRFVATYPQRDGIETRIISGLDHEGWYVKSAGIDVGARMEDSAKKAGREDLKHLGFIECDIPLMAGGGKRPAILRIQHPGGGSSYALSYAPQKITESLDGGEKPQISVFGHWHKAGYFAYRNVHILLAGAMEGQTSFLRTHKVAAHVGFWTLSFQVSKDGVVTRFLPEWFQFFNEGFYEDRFTIGIPGVNQKRVA